jgi:hypothetical protein
VRNAIHAFNQKGREALQADSSRPQHLRTVRTALSEVDADAFKALLHCPPRDFGFETSLWTLDLVAKECVKQGWTAIQVSGETIRQTLKLLGINWKRAKQWITSARSAVPGKKRLNGKESLTAGVG